MAKIIEENLIISMSKLVKTSQKDTSVLDKETRENLMLALVEFMEQAMDVEENIVIEVVSPDESA